jgi:hypothetical protein
MHKDRLKHLANFPKGFLSIPSPGKAPWDGRDNDDDARASLFHLNRKTVHQGLLSQEGRQGSPGGKDALSSPPTQPHEWVSPVPKGRVGPSDNCPGPGTGNCLAQRIGDDWPLGSSGGERKKGHR